MNPTDQFYLRLLDVHLGYFRTTNTDSTHRWDWTSSVPVCKNRLAHILAISRSRGHLLSLLSTCRYSILVLASPALVLFFFHLHGSIHVTALWIVIAQSLLALTIEYGPAALVFSHTTELIVQIAAVYLTFLLWLITAIVYDSAFVIQYAITKILVPKTCIMIRANVAILRSKVSRELAIYRLSATASA